MEKKQICLTHKHQCVGKTLSRLAPITGMLLIASCQVGRSVGGDFSLRRVTGQRMNSQGPQHCPHWALWVGATTKTSTPPQPKSPQHPLNPNPHSTTHPIPPSGKKRERRPQPPDIGMLATPRDHSEIPEKEFSPMAPCICPSPYGPKAMTPTETAPNKGRMIGELFLESYFKASYFGELFLCKLDYLK